MPHVDTHIDIREGELPDVHIYHRSVALRFNRPDSAMANTCAWTIAMRHDTGIAAARTLQEFLRTIIDQLDDGIRNAERFDSTRARRIHDAIANADDLAERAERDPF